MEEDGEGTTRGTSCKKGICTLDRCIRDDTDKYDIQERTGRVESEGLEHLSVQGFSSSMKLGTHLRTIDGLEAPVL